MKEITDPVPSVFTFLRLDCPEKGCGWTHTVPFLGAGVIFAANLVYREHWIREHGPKKGEE